MPDWPIPREPSCEKSLTHDKVDWKFLISSKLTSTRVNICNVSFARTTARINRAQLRDFVDSVSATRCG